MRWRFFVAAFFYCLLVLYIAPVWAWAGENKIEWLDNPLTKNEYSFGQLKAVTIPDGQAEATFDAPEVIYPNNAIKLNIFVGTNTGNGYFVELAFPENLQVIPVTSATRYVRVFNSDGDGFAFRYFTPLKPHNNVIRYTTEDKVDSIHAYYALVPEEPGDYSIVVNCGRNGQVYKTENYSFTVKKLPPFGKAEWKSNVKFEPYRISLYADNVQSEAEALEKIKKEVKSATVTFSSEGDIQLSRTGTYTLTSEGVETQVITDKQFPVGAAIAVSKVEYFKVDIPPGQSLELTGQVYSGSLLPNVEVVNTFIPFPGLPDPVPGDKAVVVLVVPIILLFFVLAYLLRRPVCVSVVTEPSGVRVFRDSRGPVRLKVVVIKDSHELAQREMEREESFILPVAGIGTVRVKVPLRYRNVSKQKEVVVT
ncbi:MAG: hypothetical protein K6U74_08530 [Firmicutes bacterium]|nr:hypothetical protein [Bacillota bacterium]